MGAMWRPLLVCCLLLAACERVPVDTEGNPLLHRAADAGDLSAIDRLIATGTPVNARDWCQRTPLMLAAQAGHDAAVAQLLAQGAYVDLHEKGDYTALLLAAANGHTEVVQQLAAGGADVNQIETTNGWTALIWAAQQGHATTVSALLALGADPAIRDHTGMTAADRASQAGHPDLAARLEAQLTTVNATAIRPTDNRSAN